MIEHSADLAASDTDPHRASVVAVYRAILGRDPTGGELLATTDATALATKLLDSTEYRIRFRDAVSTDANARTAMALWPAEKRDYDVQIVITSGEQWSKCAATIEAILPSLSDRDRLTVACGVRDDQPFPYAETGKVELLEFPGDSVFHVRARIPELLREAMWVPVLEDHVVPKAGWLAGVRRAVADADDATLVITGTAANETTTTPWSWANFLFNFAWHWHPSASRMVTGTVATTLFRRDLVGARPFGIFLYEENILGRVGPLSNQFTINHIQNTGWWVASVHVFDNGRVAGSALRRNSPSPRRAAWNMVSYVCTRRLGEIASVLRAHPRFGELPAGTLRRIRWISLCHSAGVLLGVVIGGGGAHKRLE